jgi:hypothetical protein
VTRYNLLDTNADAFDFNPVFSHENMMNDMPPSPSPMMSSMQSPMGLKSKFFNANSMSSNNSFHMKNIENSSSLMSSSSASSFNNFSFSTAPSESSLIKTFKMPLVNTNVNPNNGAMMQSSALNKSSSKLGMNGNAAKEIIGDQMIGKIAILSKVDCNYVS